jgi:hypothetical protein
LPISGRKSDQKRHIHFFLQISLLHEFTSLIPSNNRTLVIETIFFLEGQDDGLDFNVLNLE